MAQTRKPRSAPTRRSTSRDHTSRNWTISVGLATIATIGIAALLRRPLAAIFRDDEGHAAPDLAADAGVPGTERAPEHFRPDPTAVPSADEREALRPATGPSPSMVADRGEMRSQTGAGSAREDIAVAGELR